MRRGTRRALGITGAVLATIGLLVCVAGLAGTWFLQQEALDGLGQIAGVATKVLDIADRPLATVEGVLQDVSGIVTKLSVTLDSLLKSAEGTVAEALTPVLEYLQEELKGPLERIRQLVRSAEEAAALADGLTEVLDQIPYLDLHVQPAVPYTDSVKRVGGWLDELSSFMTMTSSELVAYGVEKGWNYLQARIPELSDPIGKIRDGIDQIASTIGGYRAAIKGVKDYVADLQGRLALYITLGAVLLTLILLWLAFSQYVVLRIALRWSRSRKLLPPPGEYHPAGG